MPYYIVGRDWPDQFYATNAKWPVANDWTIQSAKQQKAFLASQNEVQRAVDLEEQELARRESKRLRKEFFKAILQRDVDSVRRLIRRTPLLLQRHTPDGATPLWLAAAVGDPAIVNLLLDEGVDIAEGDCVGATPLIVAASRGHTQVCLQLLESKQGGNRGRVFLLRQATRRVGEVAVHAATKNGHLDTLQALLDAGGEVEAVDREGRDCLMMAAAKDHPNVMSYLIQSHAFSTNRRDSLGRTPLMHSAAGAALQAAQLLLSLQPPLEAPDLALRDGQGYGPLHHACLGGSSEVVELLTRHGLQLSPEDPESLALLRLACRSGHTGVVDWMLRSGIGLREIVSDGGAGPMFAAVRGGSAAVVDVLLRHGARIDVRDSKGRTPLAVAAEAGSTRVCEHLVAEGASLLAMDNHGRVPRKLAYVANMRGTAEVLSELARRKLGAQAEQQSEGAAEWDSRRHGGSMQVEAAMWKL